VLRVDFRDGSSSGEEVFLAAGAAGAAGSAGAGSASSAAGKSVVQLKFVQNPRILQVLDGQLGYLLTCEYQEQVDEEGKSEEATHRKGGMRTMIKMKKKKKDKPVLQYRVKILSKQKLVEMERLDSVRKEIEMLKHLDFPLLSRLEAFNQTPDEIFFFFENVQGGTDLAELITSQGNYAKHRGLASIDVIRYISACVFSALSYLHMRKVAYRSLCAENVKIDANGFVKLVDLNNAKQIPFTTIDEEHESFFDMISAWGSNLIGGVVSATSGIVPTQQAPSPSSLIFHYKAFTLCGSPEYLSPEMVSGIGHDHTNDLW